MRYEITIEKEVGCLLKFVHVRTEGSGFLFPTTTSYIFFKKWAVRNALKQERQRILGKDIMESYTAEDKNEV